jgi:hypothetical protein
MQFLEGSRFGSHPLTKRHLLCDLFGRNGSEAGGSRDRPSVWFLLLVYRTETLDQSIALGNSREPPAFTFPGRNPRSGEMPSRLGMHGKAAPLQILRRRALLALLLDLLVLLVLLVLL